MMKPKLNPTQGLQINTLKTCSTSKVLIVTLE